jgi:hypothetical protein
MASLQQKRSSQEPPDLPWTFHNAHYGWSQTEVSSEDRHPALLFCIPFLELLESEIQESSGNVLVGPKSD